MNRLIFSTVLFFGIITCFSQNKELDSSILSVKPTLKFNEYNFNKNLDKELKSKILVLYKPEDFYTNTESINIDYFSKPLSKFALENDHYNKIQFYKNAAPKQIDFINFQRNINK